MMNIEMPLDFIATMLAAEEACIEKRIALAREQIEVRERVIAHLKAWVELNDKEDKE